MELSSLTLRFPSSRLVLWNREPAGQTRLIDPQAFLPTVRLSVDSAKFLVHLTPDSTETWFCNGRHFPPNESGRRSVSIDSIGEEAGADGCVGFVRSWSMGPIGVGPDTQALHRSFAAGVSSPSPHLALSHILPLEVVPFRILEHEVQVSVHHYLPAGPLSLTPLNLMRVLPTALSDQAGKGGDGFGFLTLDKARRLVLLQPGEPRLMDCPVVGVWLSCASAQGAGEEALYAACCRFMGHEGLRDRATQGANKSFLCLVVPPTPTPPHLYEATFPTDPRGLLQSRVLTASTVLHLDRQDHVIEAEADHAYFHVPSPDPIHQRVIAVPMRSEATAPTAAKPPVTVLAPLPPTQASTTQSQAVLPSARAAAAPPPAPAFAPPPPPAPPAPAPLPVADVASIAAQWALSPSVDPRVLLALQQEQLQSLQQRIEELDRKLTQMTTAAPIPAPSLHAPQPQPQPQLEQSFLSTVSSIHHTEGEEGAGEEVDVPHVEPAVTAATADDVSMLQHVEAEDTTALHMSTEEPAACAHVPEPTSSMLHASSAMLNTTTYSQDAFEDSLDMTAMNLSSTRFLLEPNALRRAVETTASASTHPPSLNLRPVPPAAPKVLEGVPRIRFDPLEDATVALTGGIGPMGEQDEDEEDADFDIISSRYLKDAAFVQKIMAGGDPDLVALLNRRKTA